MNHQPIRTEADALLFEQQSNGLHDSHIIHMEYRNTGIHPAEEGGMCLDYDRTRLTLQVLVTSLKGHPVFELSFRHVSEYRIQDDGFADITGYSIVFLENGMILWADDI